MSLQRYVLNQREMEALDSIYKYIKEDRALFDYIRSDFKGILNNFGIQIEPYQLSRLFSKPSSGKYVFSLLLYNYTIDYLRFDIKYRPELKKHIALVDLIAGLVNEGRKKEIDTKSLLVQIDHSLEIDQDVEEIPPLFYKKYLGYRRSSNARGIIRFSINIEPYLGDRRRAYFINEYVRKDVHWVVQGSGLYINQVLYMYGHARGIATDKSLGLRFFALRPLENTDILIGPVISMNFEELLAARIVLIPLEKHNFGEFNVEAKNDTAKFVRRLLRQNASTLDAEQDILPSIRETLATLHPGADERILLQLIRNGTLTVLKGRPDWSDEEHYRVCGALAREEDDLFKNSETEFAAKKKMLSALQALTSRAKSLVG